MRQVQHRCRRDVRQFVCFEKGQLRFAVVFTNVKGKRAQRTLVISFLLQTSVNTPTSEFKELQLMC